MSREVVGFSLTGIPDSGIFNTYITQRNGTVAKMAAAYMGLPFAGEASKMIGSKTDQYLVFPKTIGPETAGLYGIGKPEDFYGAFVEHPFLVGKTAFHEPVSSDTPFYYSEEFAGSVSDFVLPGYSVFTQSDGVKAYGLMLGKGFKDVRLKLSDKSDGEGQSVIADKKHLKKLLGTVPAYDLQKKGIVLEPNLRDHRTISVGFAQFGNDVFSFIANQKNDVYEGRDRYIGADAIIVRGQMDNLLKMLQLDDPHRDAVEKALGFYNAYSYFDPVASRLSFDVLEGLDAKGNRLSGVTDITGRLGGTCPALILAALEMQRDPTIHAVRGQVNLNYNTGVPLIEELGASIFINDPTLRITARLDERII